MFIFTARLRRKRIALSVAALILVCGALAVFAGSHTFWGPERATFGFFSSKDRVKTNEDRVAYLENLGWIVEPEPVLEEKLKIPKSFEDDFLRDYIAMQNASGYALQEQAGKKVSRFTYAVINYPTGEENIMLTLLVRKGAVVGGELFSADTGEILHGLNPPDRQSADGTASLTEDVYQEHSQPPGEAQTQGEGAAAEGETAEAAPAEETLQPEEPIIFE